MSDTDGSRLHELSRHGVSVWIDSLSREMLEGGELARLMADDAVVGVTSNPTIFQKALSEGGLYDDQLRQIAATTDDAVEIFFALAQDDIRDACDLMRPVWDATGGIDGWVSLEVDPTLAYDRERTFEQAMRFHAEVERPNLYVKIPATELGLGAIEDCIAKGRSINVTLIFSLDRYAAVVEAYLRGLERLVASGGDPSTCSRSRASSSHGSTPKPTAASPRPAGPTCGVGSQSRTPSWPISGTWPSSRGRVGRSWRPRGHARNGVSGPRRRRRTRTTATSSTSRS